MIERVVQWALAQPWAIDAPRLAVMQDVLRFRAAGHRFTGEELRARLEPGAVIDDGRLREDRRSTPYCVAANGDELELDFVFAAGEELAAADPQAASTGGGITRQSVVAVVPVHGMLTQRGPSSVSEPPGSSTTEIGQAIRQLAASPAVSSIVLDVDSPGGSVFGIAELGAVVREAAAEKRVVGVANSFAASAAYWILTQAPDVVVAPGGQVGSIGVFTLHEDVSAKLEADGVKVTMISAGERKVDGNPFVPLTETAREELQAKVDAYHADFVQAVAQGRGSNVRTVRARFGRGAMVLGPDAVERGMADRVGTLQQTIEGLLPGRRRASARAAAETPPVAAVAPENAPEASQGRPQGNGDDLGGATVASVWIEPAATDTVSNVTTTTSTGTGDYRAPSAEDAEDAADLAETRSDYERFKAEHPEELAAAEADPEAAAADDDARRLRAKVLDAEAGAGITS